MKNIICVDLTKYNQSQLSKISDIIGIVDGSLQSSKKTLHRNNKNSKLLLRKTVAGFQSPIQ